MVSYQSFSDKELLDIVLVYDKLSLAAKKELKKELLNRKSIDQRETLITLENEISEEHQNIKNLAFISNLGLQIDFDHGRNFKISRSVKAILSDLLAIVTGIVFTILALIGISFLFGFSSFILGAILTIIGVSGPKILINGINRIIEYYGFSYEVVEGSFYLKKRFDLKLETIQGEVSDLYIEDDIDLKYNDISILQISANNSTNKNTLKAVLDKSQGSVSQKKPSL